MGKIETLEQGLMNEDEIHLSFQALMIRLNSDLAQEKVAELVSQAGYSCLRHVESKVFIARISRDSRYSDRLDVKSMVGKYNGDVNVIKFFGWERNSGMLSDIKHALDWMTKEYLECGHLKRKFQEENFLSSYRLFPMSEMS